LNAPVDAKTPLLELALEPTRFYGDAAWRKHPMKKSKPPNQRPQAAKEASRRPLPDRRVMEQATANLTRLLQSKQFSSIAEVMHS
jgi:hypothetical protein